MQARNQDATGRVALTAGGAGHGGDGTGPARRMLSAADLAEIIFAHAGLALTAGLVAALGLGWALLAQPPVYEARELLLYRLGRDFVYVPDAPVSGLRTPDPGGLDLFINAEMALLDSGRVRAVALERLIAAGTVTASTEAEREDLLERLEGSTSVQRLTGSHLVDLRLRDTDPAFASALMTALIEAYLATRGEIAGQDPPGFLADRIAEARARLKSLDIRIAGLSGTTSPEAHAAALDRLVAAVSTAQQDLATAEALIAGLRARVEELARMTADLAGQEAASEDRGRVAGLLAQARADLAAREAEARARGTALAALRAEAAVLASRASELDGLWAERAAELAALTQIQGRLRDSELGAARAAAGIGTVRVVEDARAAPHRVSLPDRLRIAAAGLFGLLVAALTVLLSEFASPRAHSARIARVRLGFPVLGEVEDRSPHGPRARRSPGAAAGGSA